MQTCIDKPTQPAIHKRLSLQLLQKEWLDLTFPRMYNHRVGDGLIGGVGVKEGIQRNKREIPYYRA